MSTPTTTSEKAPTRYFYREYVDSPWVELDREAFDFVKQQMNADLPQMDIPSVAAIWQGAALRVVDGHPDLAE